MVLPQQMEINVLFLQRLIFSCCIIMTASFHFLLMFFADDVINMDIPATNGVIQVVESIIEMQATSN